MGGGGGAVSSRLRCLLVRNTLSVMNKATMTSSGHMFGKFRPAQESNKVVSVDLKTTAQGKVLVKLNRRLDNNSSGKSFTDAQQ